MSAVPAGTPVFEALGLVATACAGEPTANRPAITAPTTARGTDAVMPVPAAVVSRSPLSGDAHRQVVTRPGDAGAAVAGTGAG